MPEEEKDAKLAELGEKEPEYNKDRFDRLLAINDEKSPYWKEGDEEEALNWVIREYGEQMLYNKEDGTSFCYGVVALKNQTWPGA